MLDILIKNALIYDGTGRQPYSADIGITGKKIAFVSDTVNAAAELTIDADGLIASPGFIDVHSHSEFSLTSHPEADSKLLQGVTTEINGNCGFSAAPIYNEARQNLEKEFLLHKVQKRWQTFKEYNKVLSEAKPAINFSTLTGHGNIRASVLGYKNQAAEGADIANMAALLRESVTHGSIGMSTGLIYSPGVYSSNAELIELIRQSGVSDLIYATHMRSESDAIIESIEDTIEIGRQTGIKIHISHLKTAGKHNWHKIDAVLRLIADAAAEGIKITCDRYPYTASQTSLDTALPSWTYEGGDEAELARLSNPTELKKIKAETAAFRENDDYWKGVLVSSVKTEKNRHLEGMTIADAAAGAGAKPIDFAIDLLLEERLAVDAIFFSMNEDNLRRILSLPNCMVGSDSTIRPISQHNGSNGQSGKPHPRGFGSFPRYLSKYVLSEGLMPLTEAIRKITGLPAETFGLKDRGVLRENAYADITLFDEKRIRDTSDYAQPWSAPEGIEYVFVNGRLAAKGGSLAPVRAGMLL
ncbi:N-acyl-D-amino-acid deacylase family protein [Candidatus Magnetominusculus xianensis]|uniref:N-acyl-D-amino-acid deacylase n=1 Tax=Candidatus Magnetominusculus xianensis TaxID=1748249 RepID=A0ABR5SGT1_9BACT|nr:D-aminoacylase [Candidatus Magnetominusculus xianensis]KWT90516.1 N-acyl-D-amino-acid deacylase [Candidatus Magnetominusculus xianensis]MBF0404158.1 D-aminoacylase [Nitrospirota bacterium]